MQLNIILHHPLFQRLEASWRGLRYLSHNVKHHEAQSVMIKMLVISEHEFINDLTKAFDFDYSILFKKIVSDEFDQPGGNPFGLLIGDYYFAYQTNCKTSFFRLAALHAISSIAAAAFCPFITSVSPSLFGIDNYHELQANLDLTQSFRQPEYIHWRSLREKEETSFLSLVLPQILLRSPYQYNRKYLNNNYFKEHTSYYSDYCWGNASYFIANSIIQSFYETGWFYKIRNCSSTSEYSSLKKSEFDRNNKDFIKKCITSVAITDAQEQQLTSLGFIAICDNHLSRGLNFYNDNSVYIDLKHKSQSTHQNNRFSKLQYILSASRFAHYIKVIAREKIGSYMSVNDCERYLNHWLLQYCAYGNDTNPLSKFKYPLQAAKVTLKQNPTNPGCYHCIMQLSPHYQFNQLQGTIRLSCTISFK